MAADSQKPTRAEIVRRRRQQAARERYQTVAAEVRSVRPLVSRPRHPANARTGAARPRGVSHRFEIALPGGQTLSMPTLALPRLAGDWRLASLSIVILLVGMLARLMTDPQMFVNGINLGGASLVPDQEIYAEAGVARAHIFWVDPAEVQRRVAAVPGIAEARVSVKWPASVTIVVTERTPVVTMLAGGRTWWVDAAGQRFESRGDLGLLPIFVENEADLESLPVAAIQGARQLRELRPNIEKLMFDPARGLSYQDGRGWRGYFGVGTDMHQKLAVYERLVEQVMARNLYPTAISVENLNSPFYRR